MSVSIIKKAIISEKSFQQAALGKFSFIVDKRADKDAIAQEIKNVFGFDATDVTTANIPGKVKRTRRGSGKRSDYKKAIVTLKKGAKIDLFEIEKEDKKAKTEHGEAKGDSTSKDTTVKIREHKPTLRERFTNRTGNK